MTEYSPKISDQLEKAGIHGNELELDYPTDRPNPELRQALIIIRPKDLREAISIDTEIDYGSARGTTILLRSSFVSSTGLDSVTPMKGIQ
jgi:hypothetical protein